MAINEAERMKAATHSGESTSVAVQLAHITEHAKNEEQLRHEAENVLERACSRLGYVWTPFQLERTLRRGRGKSSLFADVTHGAVVIEYEPPRCFGGAEGATLVHAREQAMEYTDLVQAEEGRSLGEYVLVAWDGAHIDFGAWDGQEYVWGGVQPFDKSAASRLLGHLRDDGIPLVHPLLLSERVGPTSTVGVMLLPALFDALHAAMESPTTSKTTLLFTEWKRLFGQVVGETSDQLNDHLLEIGQAHARDYLSDPTTYLFSLNTYIAIVAKLVAALALPNAAEDVSNPTVPVVERVQQLESGRLFLDAGITNMLNGDFFSWYAYDLGWPKYQEALGELIGTLRGISFDVTRKSPESTRDLFKGLYMTFAPPALRHALGEYYTPDWLASHALDSIGWQPAQSLLDPTCGSGTFVLEGLRRRLITSGYENTTAEELLSGVYGLDLNPLAVLSTRASLVVFVGHRLDPNNPVQIPVYLADAINPAIAVDGVYTHSLQTDKGTKTFRLPAALVEHTSYFQFMQRLRELIDDEVEVPAVLGGLSGHQAALLLTDEDWDVVGGSVTTLVELHKEGWNGIWCSILADRFAAGAIVQVDAVVGNPPWVKWSHLPPEYAEFIKPRCLELGIFSTDSWVGGIESDISTVITYEAIDKYCADGGVLAFFITGTVFSNESSQGFRRWKIAKAAKSGAPEFLRVEFVEDYAAIKPFEGVSNHPTLLVIRRDRSETVYPVSYRVWSAPLTGPRSTFPDSETFRTEAVLTDLLALPVPGSDSGPWLKGTEAEHAVWRHLFGKSVQSFQARKGVTPDANGVYWVRCKKATSTGMVKVTNDPSAGRRRNVPALTATVEGTHLFPLLRGAGVSAFKATPDPNHCIIVPQRGMHGDPTLPTTAPKTHRFLTRFRQVLESRSSYKHYQSAQPFWSLWSTGDYTFQPFKVVWKEMSGGRFQAAYISTYDDPILGTKLVIPDHKVYFVPCTTEAEAAFLTGFLNAPVVACAINAYAAQLSLGTSVVEYLRIPSFSSSNVTHVKLSALAKKLTASPTMPTQTQWDELDVLVAKITKIPKRVLSSLSESRTQTVEP